MAGGIRRSQEEEVVDMLKREGFEELSGEQIKEEPYKSFSRFPECFDVPLETAEAK